jgi:hypothetical protein
MTKKRIALEIISEACEQHSCNQVFALFSGGDDSLASLRVAVEHPYAAPGQMCQGCEYRASQLEC